MTIQENDEITIGDVIGLLPDGCIHVHHGAPPECLAVWRAGPRRGTATASAIGMTLIRQGKKPTTPPTPHFKGCGCDGM